MVFYHFFSSFQINFFLLMLQVYIHPSSVNFQVNHYDSPYLVYHEKIKTTKVCCHWLISLVIGDEFMCKQFMDAEAETSFNCHVYVPIVEINQASRPLNLLY